VTEAKYMPIVESERVYTREYRRVMAHHRLDDLFWRLLAVYGHRNGVPEIVHRKMCEATAVAEAEALAVAQEAKRRYLDG
jgi:hypothetical protein